MTDIFAQHYRLNNPPCIAELIEGETVIINLDSGNYYNLQSCSALIWEALNMGFTPAQLIDGNGWGSDVLEALNQFLHIALREGILEVAPPSHKLSIDLPLITVTTPSKDIAIAIFTDMQELLGLDPIHETDDAEGWPLKA